MQLPFTVTLKRPSRNDLRQPWFWFLAAGGVLGIVGAAVFLHGVLMRPGTPADGGATIAITSTPVGATIFIAGKERGRTPATLALSPVEHRLTLRLRAHADVAYTVRLVPGQTASLAGVLWLETPAVKRVRPPVPGTTITGAQFLSDGRVALTVASPSGDERQLWFLNRDGGARRAGPPLARVAIVPSIDGARVAYLAQSASDGAAGRSASFAHDSPANEVWITERDAERGARQYTLPNNTATERLVDLSWSPDGAGLLLVSQQRPQDGGLHTRLLWLDLAAPAMVPRELFNLPGEIVPGSYAWEPNGKRVAVLARAGGRTTLCLVGVAIDLFRSLADVAGDGHGAPPFPPLSWIGTDAEAGFVYSAPPIEAPRSLGAALPTTLVINESVEGPGRPLSDVAGQGPGWRGDGLIVALARPKRNGPLMLRAFDPATGAAQDLGAIPQPTDAPEGLRWDPARGQALIAVRGAGGGGQFDLWLVRWVARDAAVAQ